jgi:hypothetical protein
LKQRTPEISQPLWVGAIHNYVHDLNKGVGHHPCLDDELFLPHNGVDGIFSTRPRPVLQFFLCNPAILPDTVTFRTGLVLAITVAVVVAVLLLSGAAFLTARNNNPLLPAADNALTTAAQKVALGYQFGSTTATLGQVIDSSGAVVAGGGLPVTDQVRRVAGGLAPTFFTTVTVDANQERELVEHLPPGTPVAGGSLVQGGALQIATSLPASSNLTPLALLLGALALVAILLAVVLGWLVARTVSLNR